MAEKSLVKSLIAVQAALKAPKGQYNKFGGYSYRSCEDILEAVKPLLAQHGILLTLTDEIVEIGGRFYVRATAQVTDGDSGATVTAYAREEETKKGMDGSQITGSASSYARKYALNGLFCIDDTKDADATNDHGKGQPAAQPQTRPKSAPRADQPVYQAPPAPQYEVTDEMYTEIRQAFKNASEGADPRELYQRLQDELGHGISRDMTKEQWKAAYAWLGRVIAVG